MPDSFSTFEHRFVGPYRDGFARLTAPLVRLLMALGVPPNLVSASQIAVGVVIIAVMGPAPKIAFILFLTTLFLDSLDGALARTSGRGSKFGALVDQISDHTRETLVIVAVTLQGALHPGVAVLYPLVYALFNFLLYVCNMFAAPVPWTIKSYLVVYPALFLYTFFGLPWLTPAVALSEVLMTVSIGIALRNLSAAMAAGTGGSAAATGTSPPRNP